jgi:Immunity protein Imm1
VILFALSEFIVRLRERLGRSSSSRDQKKPAFEPRSRSDLTKLVRNEDSKLSEQDYQPVGMLRIHDSMNNEFLVSQAAGVNAVLRKREGDDGVNCFWLWQKKSKTPILIIHVNKDLATLHYFPSDDHPGFHSEGAMPGLDPDGDAVFFMNNLSEEERFPNYKVVPFSVALVAAKEFLVSPELPPSIRWFEL